jgi:hypothetical protein
VTQVTSETTQLPASATADGQTPAVVTTTTTTTATTPPPVSSPAPATPAAPIPAAPPSPTATQPSASTPGGGEAPPAPPAGDEQAPSPGNGQAPPAATVPTSIPPQVQDAPPQEPSASISSASAHRTAPRLLAGHRWGEKPRPAR